MAPPDERPARPPGVDLVGQAREIERFLHPLARFPYSLSTATPRPA